MEKNYTELGIDYFYKAEYKEALKCFLNALAGDTESATHYFNLGLAYDCLQDNDLAIANYKKAVEMNGHIRALNNWAIICIKEKREEDGVKLLEYAIETHPDDAEAYSQMGTIKKNKGDFDLAKSYYIKARNLDPKFFYNYYNLGLLYKDLNETEKARENFSKCLEINPDFNLAKEELAKLN